MKIMLRCLMGVIVMAATALVFDTPARAATNDAAQNSQDGMNDSDAEPPSAPVEIDGNLLFRVRGSSALPAEKRAAAIAERIEALAADASVPADSVRPVDAESGTAIFAGSQRLMVVLGADARMESMDRRVLANIIARNISAAVVNYRQARSREALRRSAALSGLATVIFVALVVFAVWLSRRQQAMVERRYRERVRSLSIQSFEIVRAERIWAAARGIVRVLRACLIGVIGYIYVDYVLSLFPWTRGTAKRLLGYFLDPPGTMGRGIVDTLPNLIFLTILYFVTRYLLKLLHLFFGAVGRGDVTISGFDREWTEATYKLARAGVIVFALVVAYPYIPGSGSEAFKGISIFIGIIFSLGSSSAIANLIAGYSMIYRRAFKVGDRVKIGDTTGDVTEIRIQATHLTTVKNEEVIIPNSIILNNEVVNFSSLARKQGLILHSTVGIGYETPWRQVEAMLLLAAERTEGLLKEPAPFVLQKALADFAVTYELNAYCNDAHAMARLYTAMHQNILDIFNEYGVQIMTPAYETDPQVPKVVPKEQWFSAPAQAGQADSKET